MKFVEAISDNQEIMIVWVQGFGFSNLSGTQGRFRDPGMEVFSVGKNRVFVHRRPETHRHVSICRLGNPKLG